MPPEGDAQCRKSQTTGVSIHYRVEGSGPALVLQHGFADSCDSLYDFGYVEALKSKYRLIIPDTRGHGHSSKPHDPEAYTPLKFAGDITAVLDDAGIQRCCYWGYSQGGWIGFALAQYAPERFSCFVIGGAASAGSAFQAEPGQEDPLIAALQQGADALPPLFGEWLSFAGRSGSHERYHRTYCVPTAALSHRRISEHRENRCAGASLCWHGRFDSQCGTTERIAHSRGGICVASRPKSYLRILSAKSHLAPSSKFPGKGELAGKRWEPPERPQAPSLEIVLCETL